jgi:hypothetical protein
MAEATFSLDLHVLGPPLTFALSQDQTLRRKFEPAHIVLTEVWPEHPGGSQTHDAEWFHYIRTKPIICDLLGYPDRSLYSLLAIQFSETDPAEVYSGAFRLVRSFFSSVSTVVRRGMLLIRGET